ncbi:tetratricopeptide repeat protein [Neotabrizicola shimadae]|uniref:Tetratricopeptide repeat protein n=1 Tax=Neotabrizicola shimadae TaxID=2807096 RepID=A0A8G0ZX08_9RHOB|nr:tetratricopeptide repeat protein [Neotabrizicola shimadae]QYZ70245.1 tetratricopeptide repeat protein [Neotabrizicola shimadae]
MPIEFDDPASARCMKSFLEEHLPVAAEFDQTSSPKGAPVEAAARKARPRPGAPDPADLKRIRDHLADREAREAERLCRRVLQAQPGHHATLALLCRALLAQNRLDAARGIVDRLDRLKAEPDLRQSLREVVQAAERRQLETDLRAALKAEDLATARALLDTAAPDRSGHPTLRKASIRLLIAEERLAEAEAECRALLAESETSGGEFQLCNVLRRQGRHAEARELFRSRLWTGEFTPEQRAEALGWLVEGLTAAEAEAFLGELEAIRAPTTAEMARMAMFEARVGRPALALSRLEALDREGQLSPLMAVQIVNCLVQTGRLDEAMARIGAMKSSDPDNPDWHLKQAIVHHFRNEPDAAARCIAEGLNRWPGEHRLLRALQMAAFPPARLERLVARIDAARRKAEFSDAANLEFAVAALQARAVAPAMDALGAVQPGRSEPQLLAADLRRLLSDCPEDLVQTRARFRDDVRASMQVVQAAGAVATVVIFPNLRGNFGLLPLDFADALLSRHPVNVIYLRDRGRSAFLAPTQDLGGSVDGLADLLRQQARDLGDLPVLTIGTSSGGFAALWQAAAIGARGAITFSGPTRLHSSEDRPADSNRRVGLSFLEGLPEEARDVIPALRARAGLRIWHIAAADHAEDRRQQARIAGLPGVETMVLDGAASHNTLLPAVLSGLFDRLIADALEGL